MPVRTIEELAQDVVDTMLHTRHLSYRGEDEYLEFLSQVLPRLVPILVDLPESALRSCVRDVVENVRVARSHNLLQSAVTLQRVLMTSGRSRRPSNPSTVASTLGSPQDQTHPTIEGSHCHVCGGVSQLIRTQCHDEDCICFGEHLEDTCHQCGEVFDATPLLYNAPEGIRLHRWRVVPLEQRPMNNPHSRNAQYLLECENCHMHANAWISDDGDPSMDHSIGYNSPCGAVLEHEWVKTSYGDDNQEDRYVCDTCGEVVRVPCGSNWFNNTACSGFHPEDHKVTIRMQVKKNIPEPTLHPTRFERDPVI